jgi:site-specific DNA recombinase
MLTDPDRKTSRGNALTWLGTGLYRCGRCPDQTVICTYRGIKARGTQRRVYRCPSCYMTRVADPIDHFVELVVVKRLRRADLADVLASPTGNVDTGALRTEAAALRVRINALGDDLSISEQLLARREKALRKRLGEIERQLAEAGRGSAAGSLVGRRTRERRGSRWTTSAGGRPSSGTS